MATMNDLKKLFETAKETLADYVEIYELEYDESSDFNIYEATGYEFDDYPSGFLYCESGKIFYDDGEESGSGIIQIEMFVRDDTGDDVDIIANVFVDGLEEGTRLMSSYDQDSDTWDDFTVEDM